MRLVMPCLVCVLSTLIPHAFPATAQEAALSDPMESTIHSRLMANRWKLGLNEKITLEVKSVERDPSGAAHVRIQQFYRGLRVWGGQAITHTSPQGVEEDFTDALVRDINVETHPNLSSGEALATAQNAVGPKGSYVRPPSSELLIYPESCLQPAFSGSSNAEDFLVGRGTTHLAYHIHMELENGPEETRHDDCLVDAHTGALLKRWSTLFTFKPPAKAGVPIITIGNSQYSGEVELGSLSLPCGFVLSDPTRKNLVTRNLAGQTHGEGSLYVSQVPRWGDGQNYDSERGAASENGQTAAVDAHYGLQSSWDFYKNVLGRNGIDGKGTPTHNLVHYARNYDNAFWSDRCFCMTYGDGSTFNTLTALDVVGHEVSHGLCHATADLGYSGESGGLNEANSDIFGAMITFYARGALGKGSRIPDVGGRWNIGHDLQNSNFPRPLRYMNRPSLDGFSPDAWTPDLDSLDVHYSSGPMNRAFFFLSQGASSRKGDDDYSTYLPKGMSGLGNDKALRIWWRTLLTRLTPTSRYVDARNGAVAAAEELYGKDSPEVWAVRRAFKAINVGKAEPQKPTLNPRSQGAAELAPSE